MFPLDNIGSHGQNPTLWGGILQLYRNNATSAEVPNARRACAVNRVTSVADPTIKLITGVGGAVRQMERGVVLRRASGEGKVVPGRKPCPRTARPATKPAGAKRSHRLISQCDLDGSMTSRVFLLSSSW